MEECGYDAAFMFKYSERPGTYASKHLPDDVPEEVKIRRLNEIIALQNRLSAEANARCVGKTYEVLVEGVSKRSRDQLFGRTEQNRVVVFDRGTHRVGDFVNVKITESSSATLKGKEVWFCGNIAGNFTGNITASDIYNIYINIIIPVSINTDRFEA